MVKLFEAKELAKNVRGRYESGDKFVCAKKVCVQCKEFLMTADGDDCEGGLRRWVVGKIYRIRRMFGSW